MAPTVVNRAKVQAKSDGNLLAFVYAVLVTAALVGLVRYDRRPPLIYNDTQIVPHPARPGGDITINRFVEWRRECSGEAVTEIVTPKGYVYRRQTTTTIVPRIGHVAGSTTWTLPADLLPEGDSVGTATYRGSISFSDCGFTSWLVPLTIPYQVRQFDVKR